MLELLSTLMTRSVSGKCAHGSTLCVHVTNCTHTVTQEAAALFLLCGVCGCVCVCKGHGEPVMYYVMVKSDAFPPELNVP